MATASIRGYAFREKPERLEKSGLGEPQWYAIRVRSRYEKAVADSLFQRDFEALCPVYHARRRWSDRSKVVEFPLFPGYVFSRFDLEDRLKVLRVPGIVSIISFGGEMIPVGAAEIEAIRTILRAGDKVAPWPYFRSGQRVRVRSGSLHGIEGRLLVVKDVHRLVVSIDILQRSVAVELDPLSVEPVF